MRSRRIILIAFLCGSAALKARVARAATWQQNLESAVHAASFPEQKRYLSLVAEGVRLMAVPTPQDTIRTATEGELTEGIAALIDSKLAVDKMAAGCTTFNTVQIQEQCLTAMDSAINRAAAVISAQSSLQRIQGFDRLHEVRRLFSQAIQQQIGVYRNPLAQAKQARADEAARQRAAAIEAERQRLAQQAEFARQAEAAQKRQAAQKKKTAKAMASASRALDSQSFQGYSDPTDTDVEMHIPSSQKTATAKPSSKGFVTYGESGDSSINAVYAQQNQNAELQNQRIAQVYKQQQQFQQQQQQQQYQQPQYQQPQYQQPQYQQPQYQAHYQQPQQMSQQDYFAQLELEKQRAEKERVAKEQQQRALAEQRMRQIQAENAERERIEAARQMAETRLRSEVRGACKRILEGWGFAVDVRQNENQTLYARYPGENWVNYHIVTEDMAQYDGGALAGKIRTYAGKMTLPGLLLVLNRGETDNIEDGDYDDIREPLRERLPDAKLKELIIIHAGDARPLIANGAVLDEE